MGTERSFHLPILLAAVCLSAVVSAVAHPSSIAPAFLESLAACCVLAQVLSYLPSRMTVPVLLSTLTITAAAALTWIGWTQPQDLAAKSPLLAWLPPATAAPPAAFALSPNVPGLLAAIAASAWAAFAVSGASRPNPSRRRVPVGGLLAAASLAIVIASGSRAALLALFAGVLAAFVLQQSPRVAIITVAGLVILVTAAIFTVPGRALTTATLADTVASNHWNSFERIEVWGGTLRAIAASPLTGRGVGAFPVAYEPGAGSPDPVGAHNTALQIALDLGLLGVLAFAALVSVAGIRAGVSARHHPEALIVAAAGAAWLVVGVFESTVIGSWRQEEPWFGWHEVVTPLAFAIVGVAFAQRDRVVRPGRAVIAVFSAIVIVLLSLPLALSPTEWARPPGVTDDAVMAAARAWIRGCATTSAGVRGDCPQATATGDQAQAVGWASADPLLEHASVTWSSAMGLFIARGNFNLRYAGRCGHSATPRAGLLHGYFIVGLRPAGDHRDFGAYALTADTKQVDGFWVVNRYRWMLEC